MRYGARIHDRQTDNDPSVATIMYAHAEDGPWFDMASGDPDHVWDILGALQWRDEALRNREERDRQRLAAEVNGTPQPDIVDLLRGPVEDSDLCWDAAAEIERLRENNQRLLFLYDNLLFATRGTPAWMAEEANRG